MQHYQSIRLHDKLLLVLSENSVGSRWVEQEVETALAEEEAGREVLFPVRLDDTVMGIQTGWPALVKRTRHRRGLHPLEGARLLQQSIREAAPGPQGRGVKDSR